MMARKRLSGEGSVYRDKARGGWVAERRFRDPHTRKTRRMRARGDTGDEAKDRLDEKIRAILEDSGHTFDSMFELWAAAGMWSRSKGDKSEGSQDTYRYLYQQHVRGVLGEYPLEEVSTEDIDRLLRDASTKSGAPLARSSLVKVRSLIRQVFTFAVARRHVAWNPAEFAVLPSTARDMAPGRKLERWELRALLARTSGERLGSWVETAVSLGLRPGEVSGLTWSAIDFDAGVVRIDRSMGWVKSKPVLKALKTRKSQRRLTLPPPTADTLRRHRAAQNEERLLMGDQWPKQWADLVFVSEVGTPLDPSVLRRWLRKMATEAGIGGIVNPYDLRHTMATMLDRDGVPPQVIADLLGHVDTRMFYHHYRDPDTEAMSAAAEHWGRFTAESGG